MAKQTRDYSRCSRRDFIKNAMTGVGTIALGSFSVSLFQGCAGSVSKSTGTFAAAAPGSDGPSITVDMSKPENKALAETGGTLALGKSDVDDKGILLHRESETIVKAYSRECTHQGCTVGPFVNGVCLCPCHASQFNLSGENISGPAALALYQYTASIKGNIITISDISA